VRVDRQSQAFPPVCDGFQLWTSWPKSGYPQQQHAPRTVIRKLAPAGSPHFGTDCFLHMELAQALLSDLGVNTRTELGYAAWRVGPGDHDVISNVPFIRGYASPGVKSFAYHTWLEYRGLILDFTTYQLRDKPRLLDSTDQYQTTVTWCPDFLILPRKKIRSLAEVRFTSHSGAAYYEGHPELKTLLRPQFGLSTSYLPAARLLLANPEAIVRRLD
jgi:hypothetical protein